MYTYLHRKFKSILDEYIENQAIAIALSGGQDSLCLLKLLADCTNKNQAIIQIIYIDHQWKNGSKKHAQHILNMAKFTKVPATVYQIKQPAGSENKARKIRYRILFGHASKQECKIIMTGHNSSDQIETLVGNLVRGSSLNGMTSFTMYKKINRHLSIMRPMIYFSKAEITWLCRLFYLPIWSDKTNYNLTLKRNRIRHELLPYIQNFFNPRLEQNLKSFMSLYREENEYIKENTIKLYIKSKHKYLIGMNLKIISKQHKILKKRVLRLYLYHHFNEQASDKIISWVLQSKNKPGQRFFHSSQLSLEIHKGWLYSCQRKI